MGYAQNVLKQQLANNSRNKDFGQFNVDDITATQMNKLRNDVYGGYKAKLSGSPRYEMKGAGSGRRSVQTGYHAPGTNFDYYKSHAGWSAIGAKLGISNINSQNDVRQLYDFVNGYKPPAAAAPAAAAPDTLMPQISEASQQYMADARAILDEATKVRDEFNAAQAARSKSQAIAAANQSRSGQTANLQIQPASSTPKTAGTDAFRIRKRRGSDQKQLASSLNIGQSNTLNI